MKNLDFYEFQVKKDGSNWNFCSYSTFLKYRKNGLEVRKRNLKTGASWE